MGGIGWATFSSSYGPWDKAGNRLEFIEMKTDYECTYLKLGKCLVLVWEI